MGLPFFLSRRKPVESEKERVQALVEQVFKNASLDKITLSDYRVIKSIQSLSSKKKRGIFDFILSFTITIIDIFILFFLILLSPGIFISDWIYAHLGYSVAPLTGLLCILWPLSVLFGFILMKFTLFIFYLLKDLRVTGPIQISDSDKKIFHDEIVLNIDGKYGRRFIFMFLE
jgi:hypothetical protein